MHELKAMLLATRSAAEKSALATIVMVEGSA